jgi:hypothetical protein
METVVSILVVLGLIAAGEIPPGLEDHEDGEPLA